MIKKLGTLLLILFVIGLVGYVSSRAQVALPSPPPRLYFRNSAGGALSNGFVYTYVSGTSTPQSTFTDATGSTPNSNPVVLDAAGSAAIWLSSGLTYRFVIQTSGHVPLFTIDGIAGLVPTIAGNGVNQVTASAPLTSTGGVLPNIAATVSGTGARLQTTNASSSTLGDVATYDGAGNTQDSGTLLSSLAPLASPHFTGTPVLPSNVLPIGVLTGGVNGNCAINVGGVWQAGSCSGVPGGVQLLSINNTTVTITPNGAMQNLMTYTSSVGLFNTLNKTIRISGFGFITPAGGAQQVQFQVQINSGTSAVFPQNTISFTSNYAFSITLSTTLTGATGTIRIGGALNMGSGGSEAYGLSTDFDVTNIDLTAATTIKVQGKITGASSHLSEDQLTVEALN